MSLYLKYRPQDFNNLVGQDFVKNTLKKSILENKTVGAYLLCGPRGTGKTSTARILAKTINCLNQKDGNPCLECNICKDFLEEKLIDIIEIDAASHTGVDNIRELIERAQFKPTHTKYKIYIIDEVHMLSKGAFNALLKILEEPPEHIKFILATTETHKVPETIISRCQRYDFKRINDIDIEKRLEFVAKSEEINIDKESINYIIKNSGGGLRNALTLFEQFVINKEISIDNIITNLGLVSKDKFELFLNKLINKEKDIINDFDNIINEGKNLKLFFKELIFYTKNHTLEELKKGNDIYNLINILDILDETFTKTKNSLDENTTFLIGIIKIISDYDKQKNISNNKSEEIIQDKTTSKSIPSEELNIQSKHTLKENISKNTENISTQDINDIFGETGLDENKNESNPSSSNNFDKENFITELKKVGAKGGLTMALRGTNIELFGNELNIYTKTKIAKNQVTNSDNQNLIISSLENIGFSDIKLIIN